MNYAIRKDQAHILISAPPPLPPGPPSMENARSLAPLPSESSGTTPSNTMTPSKVQRRHPPMAKLQKKSSSSSILPTTINSFTDRTQRTFSWTATAALDFFGVDLNCHSFLSIFNFDCLRMRKLRDGNRHRRGLGHEDEHCAQCCRPRSDQMEKSFGVCKFFWNVITAILALFALYEATRSLARDTLNSGENRLYTLSSQLHQTEDCHALPPLAIRIGGQTERKKDDGNDDYPFPFYVHIKDMTIPEGDLNRSRRVTVS